MIYNSPFDEVKRAVALLVAAKCDHVWLIYNGKDDVMSERLRNLSVERRIEFLRIPNRGYGAGHNIAIKHSIELGAEYHLVMNADLYWESEVLSVLLEEMDAKPKVGLIAPMTINPNGTSQSTARRLPTPFDLFGRRFLPKFIMKKRNRKYLLEDVAEDKELNVPYLLGCFMLFRNRALKEIGGFDERFFMYSEDIDITRRLHTKWQTIRTPKVRVIHKHQRESKRHLKLLLCHIISTIHYFNKWGWLFDNQRRNFNRKIDRQKLGNGV